MDKQQISTGATLGLTAGMFKAAVGVLVAAAAAVGAPMTGDTASDAVTLAIFLVGVWLHNRATTAPAAIDTGAATRTHVAGLEAALDDAKHTIGDLIASRDAAAAAIVAAP